MLASGLGVIEHVARRQRTKNDVAGGTQPRSGRGFYAWFLRFCARFGDAEAGIGHALLALAFFVTLRNYLEIAISDIAPTSMHVVHYTLFYFGLALSIVLVLHGLTGKPVTYVVRLVFPGMILTLLPPMLDGTVFADRHFEYDYLPRGTRAEVLHAYLTWFGPLVKKGVTLGMRIEIAIATLAMAVFVHAHTRSFVRACLAAWLGYSVLFGWCSLPAYFEIPAELAGETWKRDPRIIGVIAILCVGLTIAAWARARPAELRAILRDMRWLRLLHYELLLLLGVCMNARPEDRTDAWAFDCSVAQAALAVALVWVFSVVNNNLHDLEIDRINAPERPLVTGAVDRASYELAGTVAFLLALGLAAWIHAAAFMVVAIFGLGYFVYSSPPLRLKENCGVSKLVIGLNSLGCLVLGAGLLSGRLDIAATLAFGVFVWFSLGAHMIDLKDIEGDRAAGIRNLSTMLGLRRAQLVIGGSAVIAHAVIAYLVRDSWVAWPIAVAGVLQLWFVTRSPFREAPVLVLQNAVTIAFIVRTVSLAG